MTYLGKHGDESFYIRIEEMSDKNGNKKQNWPKIFIRYERFPNNFNEHLISQLPINIPEKCIDKPDDLLIPFQIHIKDEYLFHTPDLSMNLSKMLIKNETDYKFIETPNLMPFSANSEHGKAIRKDKKTFFYKKMLNENRYQTEIDGYSRLLRYYRKIQKPTENYANTTFSDLNQTYPAYQFLHTKA